MQKTSINDLEVGPGIEFSGMILKNRKKNDLVAREGSNHSAKILKKKLILLLMTCKNARAN